MGSQKQDSCEEVLSLYRRVEAKSIQLAELAGIEGSGHKSPKHFVVGRNSAELIKVAANSFLAMKISFANSIAKLADAADANIVEVMDGMGADSRIGRAFLNAGRGYGGGCFPKDVSGLIASAHQHGVELPIMAAVT